MQVTPETIRSNVDGFLDNLDGASGSDGERIAKASLASLVTCLLWDLHRIAEGLIRQTPKDAQK
jgi:hypothetical protein